MGRGGLGGLKNKLPANNNNGERSTRAAKKQNKKKLPSVIFLAIGMLQSGREIVSLSSSSFPTLSPIFFWGGGFFFFALQKKAQIMHNIVFCGLSSWGETFTSSAGR